MQQNSMLCNEGGVIVIEEYQNKTMFTLTGMQQNSFAVDILSWPSNSTESF